MAVNVLLKPTHKAIQEYYQALQEYRDQGVHHEGALETAFQQLLARAAKVYSCTLIPKQKLRVGKINLFPDGTIRDLFARRGFWEAKDMGDDLDREIAAKIAKGYPLSNTIFEDTRCAVLFQGGIERARFDLTDKIQLADLLNEFFGYTEPEIETFQQAVEEFKDRVPDLANGLVGKLKEAHQTNKKFQAAFESFLAVCQSTLNPNISRDAVDEMLVQHLLTERLIRKIFDNPEFMHRNIIAGEIEKVIQALVGLSFSREDFLKSLDRFYRAIEDAAHTLEDFSEKQHFLNTVYERFFQGYSVKIADTHGIVYTPQEIVDFMCASVAEALESEFGLTLGSRGVNFLDPCTGTGNFIVNLLDRIPKRDLPRVYQQQLFANEVMLLPYYIAALNIEHAYWERTGHYEAFEGLCFVDTLDLVNSNGDQPLFEFMNEENSARVARQKITPITVIIGNPPYNVGQVNENDANKNRKYAAVDRRVKETFGKASAATSVSKINDPYVKFFRWAMDRLEDRDGIVCFVTNNSFVEQIAFDGMRRHLAQEFSRIYHVHLEGNVRLNPKLSGTQYNVFGIQVGVGITLAIRRKKHRRMTFHFHRVDKKLRREEKLDWLANHVAVSKVKWRKITPEPDDAWLAPANGTEFAKFLPIGSKEGRSAEWNKAQTVFQEYGLGVATHRDKIVYDFDRPTLVQRVKEFIDAYNGEVDRYRRVGGKADPDTFVRYDNIIWDRDLKKDLTRGRYAEFAEGKIRLALFHPFTKKFLFFDRIVNAEVYTFPKIMPTPEAAAENRVICVPGPGGRANWATIITDGIPNLSLTSLDTFQCFPFYIYEKLEPYPLEFKETEGVPLSYRVEDKMRLDAGKKFLHVNKSLTLGGVPPDVFQYRLGNRSALEWVIDQFQVSVDKRSGARSDPNRAEDEEYIVRLVGQVVHVSLETMRIADSLPSYAEASQ